MKTLIHFVKDKSGATAIEYGLIAALVAVGLIASDGSGRLSVGHLHARFDHARHRVGVIGRKSPGRIDDRREIAEGVACVAALLLWATLAGSAPRRACPPPYPLLATTR
jgi:pilus assembly protein Flp/PilA